MSEPFGLPQVVESDLVRPVARGLTHARLQGKLHPGAEVSEAAGNGRLLSLSSGPAPESRAVIGLIGRLRYAPMTLAPTHAPLLEAIEAGQPDRIPGGARREVGLPVTSLSPATQEVP